jgi:CubicO group peptidase (beta-lactamase class C family)
MRLAAIALVALFVAAPLFAQPAPPEFPATDPGHHARDFFAAFNQNETAMRDFWTQHGSVTALAQRPVEPRLGVWRQMRTEHGVLTPMQVTQTSEDFCEVRAHAEKGPDILVGFMCEPNAPHGLVALRVQPADDPDAQPPVPNDNPGDTPTEHVDQGPPPSDEELVHSITTTLDSLARQNLFWGTAMLAKGTSTLLCRSYGPACRVPQRPNAEDTRYNLGSLNKIITHVAILQLAQAGKLSLDDPVTRYLPDYQVTNAGQITIRMLLDHRGGVPDVLANPDLDRDRARLFSNADWYHYVTTMPLRFTPGTRQEYSNGGFVLLGQVVAKVSGEDYYAYVSRHIYAPAGMMRTEHLATGEKLNERAIGYSRDVSAAGAGTDTTAGLVPNTLELPNRGSSAGGGYSTVGDLVKFANALRAHRLLNAAYTTQLIGPRFSIGIAGGSPGVNGILEMAGPYTLVVLANLDPPAAEQLFPMAGGMVRRAAGFEPAPRRQQVGGPR